MSKNITIKRLRLTNFKGAKSLEVSFSENATTIISGRNASGKTTVIDAFLWLLWGMNSEDQTTAKFGIKPQSPDGSTLLDLNPEVEGEFNIVDTDTGETQTVTLRKRWVGQWRTAKGETEREFKGNKGEYFRNDVPIKESDYNTKVNELINVDVFKTITNPYYFANLSWKERREMLLSMADEVTYADIAKEHKAFADLMATITGKTVDEYNIEITKKISRLNKEIEEIPIKIEEVQRNTPITPNYDALALQKKELEGKYTELENQILAQYREGASQEQRRQEAKAEIAALQARQKQILAEAETAAWTAQSELREAHNIARHALDQLEDEHGQWLQQCRQERSKLEYDYAEAQRLREETDRKIAELRQEWYKIGQEQFTQSQNLVCPVFGHQCCDTSACAAYNNNWTAAEANFKALKEQRQSGITATGRELTQTTLKEQEAAIANLAAKIQDTTATEAAENSRYQAAREIALINLQAHPAPGAITIKDEDLPEWISLREQIRKINERLEQEAKEPSAYEAQKLRASRQSVAIQLDEVKRKLGLKETIDFMNRRKEELQKRQNTLIAERASTQRIQAVLEQMNKARMAEVENRVNKLFKVVRFQMFEPTATTDEEKPNCVIWINGVKYQDQNRAMKLNAGLDIINTFCSYYGVTAPVFIDNAESVNEVLPTQSQQILLKVSTGDFQVQTQTI